MKKYIIAITPIILILWVAYACIFGLVRGTLILAIGLVCALVIVTWLELILKYYDNEDK